MEFKISAKNKGKSKRPLEGQVKSNKQWQSLHESRKRHFCAPLALTTNPVIQRMKVLTLAKFKMFNGFRQKMQQKMKKSFH